MIPFPGISIPWSIAEDLPMGAAGTQEVMLVQSPDPDGFLVVEAVEIDKGDANITSVEFAFKDENGVYYRIKLQASATLWQSGPIRQVSPVKCGHLIASVMATAASVTHPRIIANGGLTR